MLGTCRLNNKVMRNIRHTDAYQCLVIDLGMLGILSKEECELLIGSGIPKNLYLPNKQNNMVSDAEIERNAVAAEETEED